MAELKQSKRVSWASPVNLCQVRFFLSDETPAQSGSGAQDQLQAKSSWLWHSHGTETTNENLPPGFNIPRPILQRPKTTHIPLVQWKSPAKFSLSNEWFVVAGEESTEVELQTQRQMGIFEAIYPRLSSIPPNPITTELSDLPCEDPPPLIPVTAIEDDLPEDEAAVDLQFGSIPDRSEKPLLQVPPGVEPDVAAAAAAAFTALVRSKEAGSLIDPDLLVKILSNPGLIEKLLSGRGPQEAVPVQPIPATRNVVGIAAGPITDVQMAGNADYFKTLIQQHGVDESFGRQTYPFKGTERANKKPKASKVCAFFNSPRGCRNGASCLYIHDTSLSQKSDLPSSKKIKLDTEIARRA